MVDLSLENILQPLFDLSYQFPATRRRSPRTLFYTGRPTLALLPPAKEPPPRLPRPYSTCWELSRTGKLRSLSRWPVTADSRHISSQCPRSCSACPEDRASAAPAAAPSTDPTSPHFPSGTGKTRRQPEARAGTTPRPRPSLGRGNETAGGRLRDLGRNPHLSAEQLIRDGGMPSSARLHWPAASP